MAKSYKELSEKLDGLLNQLEDGSLDLDKAIDTYAEAAKLVEEIKQYLAKAEVKIKKIDTHAEK